MQKIGVLLEPLLTIAAISSVHCSASSHFSLLCPDWDLDHWRSVGVVYYTITIS